jgi:hypothetical protein
MCGNSPWAFIIGGLILAAAMLMTAHPQSAATRAAPVQHTIRGPAAHVAIDLRPFTLDIDFAHARVSLDVSL